MLPASRRIMHDVITRGCVHLHPLLQHGAVVYGHGVELWSASAAYCGAFAVQEEMQGLLAKLGATPLRKPQRSLTPQRRVSANGSIPAAHSAGPATATPPTTAGSGFSSSSVASRGSGVRGRLSQSTTFHTHSSAGTSTGARLPSEGSSRGPGLRGPLAHAGAGALHGAAVAPALAERVVDGGAELRSEVSDASLDRLDSAGGQTKLLGAPRPRHMPVSTLTASPMIRSLSLDKRVCVESVQLREVEAPGRPSIILPAGRTAHRLTRRCVCMHCRCDTPVRQPWQPPGGHHRGVGASIAAQGQQERHGEPQRVADEACVRVDPGAPRERVGGDGLCRQPPGGATADGAPAAAHGQQQRRAPVIVTSGR